MGSPVLFCVPGDTDRSFTIPQLRRSATTEPCIAYLWSRKHMPPPPPSPPPPPPFFSFLFFSFLFSRCLCLFFLACGAGLFPTHMRTHIGNPPRGSRPHAHTYS